ncbi:MAG: 3'-5' exonuclease [Patescibacteria group bacterium]
MKKIFLDTETTGNEMQKDRLCQICYKVDDVVRTEYFKPPVPMTVKSMSITHITNRMLEGKKPFEGSEMKKDLQELLNIGVLIAHNALFDITMLKSEGMSVPKYICTLRVARALDKEAVIPEYNLQFLRYYLDLEVSGNAHDAEGDVLVLEAVFGRLLAKVVETEGSEEKALEKMIEISSTPSLYVKFNFGKHKDKKLEDVAKNDRGYLEWLLNQKVAQRDSGEGDDEDWIYTLNYYLGK